MRDAYWELVRNSDYGQRDHNLIQRYYQTLGCDMTISGQDGSRWIACSENDLARVTTTACHARYIGETGEHFDPEHYRRCKFAESVLYPSDHALVASPDELIADWIRRERRKLKTFYVHDYLARLFPEEAEEMTPPHLRATPG